MLDQLPEVYYPVFEMTVFVHDKKMHNEATVTKLIAHKLVLNHMYRLYDDCSTKAFRLFLKEIHLIKRLLQSMCTPKESTPAQK